MNIFLIITVVVIYLLITAFLGYLGYKHTKNTSDYLVAGRKTHPLIMAISYGATFISTSAIVGFGGAAAVFGMGLLWLTVLNIFVGIFIAFAFFGKRTRKMGHNLDAHTFPELLGKRFNSKFLQAVAGLLIFVGMPIYAGSVMIGAAQFICQTLGIDYQIGVLFFTAIVAVYVMMGGLKGVMYTDAFQGSIMFVGMAILLIYTYNMLGGVVNAHQQLAALSGEAVKVFGKGGHLGWTQMPAFKSVMWLQLVTTIVMGVGIGVLAQPQLIVRFMTVKSNREIHRGIVAGGVFILMMTGVAFVVGALSNVFFFNNPETAGKIAIVAAKKNVDAIIPLFINMAMPPWFTAVFMVTLLAAAMSTLSSQFHTMGTAAGRDFYEQGLNRKTGSSIYITRIAMALGILLSLFVALLLPKFLEMGSAIIAIGTALFFGLCASAFLPMYFGALYTKGITKAGALSGFFAGALSSLLWMTFVHSKESVPIGLCKLIFKVDTLAGASKWAFLDPLIIALPISIIVTLAVSMMTKPPSEEHLKKCFDGI